jgi:hypothetical protein
VKPPKMAHRWTFYVKAPGGFTVEVLSWVRHIQYMVTSWSKESGGVRDLKDFKSNGGITRKGSSSSREQMQLMRNDVLSNPDSKNK